MLGMFGSALHFQNPVTATNVRNSNWLVKDILHAIILPGKLNVLNNDGTKLKFKIMIKWGTIV